MPRRRFLHLGDRATRADAFATRVLLDVSAHTQLGRERVGLKWVPLLRIQAHGVRRKCYRARSS